MKYTEKLGLKKPELTDYVNIEDINENMDILDEQVGELKEGSTVIEDLQTENKTLSGAINELSNKKVDKVTGKGLSTNDYTDEEKQKNQDNADNISDLQQELETHKAENVQQFEEIYNRLSKLKGNDIQARREILDIKLKLDEMKVVDYLNKTGVGFYDLFENIEYIDVSNTTATVDTASADVIFTGQESLKMLPQKFDENFNNIELAIYDIERENFEVDNSVSNSTQIQITIQPGKTSIGDKYYYNGEVYEVTGVSEA